MRKIVFDHAGLTPETHVDVLGRTVADELLEPTRIYTRAVKTVYRNYRVKQRRARHRPHHRRRPDR